MGLHNNEDPMYEEFRYHNTRWSCNIMGPFPLVSGKDSGWGRDREALALGVFLLDTGVNFLIPSFFPGAQLFVIWKDKCLSALLPLLARCWRLFPISWPQISMETSPYVCIILPSIFTHCSRWRHDFGVVNVQPDEATRLCGSEGRPFEYPHTSWPATDIHGQTLVAGWGGSNGVFALHGCMPTGGREGRGVLGTGSGEVRTPSGQKWVSVPQALGALVWLSVAAYESGKSDLESKLKVCS